MKQFDTIVVCLHIEEISRQKAFCKKGVAKKKYSLRNEYKSDQELLKINILYVFKKLIKVLKTAHLRLSNSICILEQMQPKISTYNIFSFH